MDPEIASLLGDIGSQGSASRKIVPSSPVRGNGDDTNLPDFTQLFGPTEEPPQSKADEVDISRKGFIPLKKMEEESPHPYFADPQFYQKALGGEGESAQVLHAALAKYLKATDSNDRSLYRQKIIPAFWNVLESVSAKLGSNIPDPKRLMLRFGTLLPNMLEEDQRQMICKIVDKNETGEPVYYLDEWLKDIALGVMKPSITDEIKPTKSTDQDRLQNLLTKAQGRRDAAESLLKSRIQERLAHERALKEKVDAIVAHPGQDGLSPYTDSQKKMMSDVGEIMRNMVKIDKELGKYFEELETSRADFLSVQQKLNAMGPNTTVNSGAVAQEFETIRQMSKLCVGRQGNHFPILSKEYFHGSLRDVGTRENVLSVMAWIEAIDATAFSRSYRNTLNRIVPYVILLPSYGDFGICWEPFDKYNRATSRSRIVVPMYPKNLNNAVLTAVGDLRWQVAKEKASYYWMEEGFTGAYYQWFTSLKLRGDIKEYFVRDYITWVTKESEGAAKLDKEVREIFWRFLPFSAAIKDKLKNRGFIYQELYKRDRNREMSDGY